MNTSRQYFGLNDLDLKMEPYIDYDRGFFVEIGANDGVSQSNTLYYERYRDWSGVLVEPSPDNFQRCRANRSSASKVFCAACVPFDYKETHVPMVYSNLMSVANLPGNDLPDIVEHAMTGKQFLQTSEDVHTFLAPARTLNEILLEAVAPKVIDFFSLDVEGVEIPLLQGIDHSQFRFRYILVESRTPDKMKEYLGSLDYKAVAQLSYHDYLFSSVR